MVKDQCEVAGCGGWFRQRIGTVQWRMISDRQLQGDPLSGLEGKRVLDWAEHKFRRVRSQGRERDGFGNLCRFGHGLFLTKTDSEWNRPVLYIIPMPCYR
ncbi:protein of unknown function [Nitrospira defluvii]|uniref:Uncharacterized protein n=1 Tax=Nitrospira defluvii TaxID=330214 RepID=D8P857_9BACT|nr:protein of unknown function [Nitrospira defluvii]